MPAAPRDAAEAYPSARPNRQTPSPGVAEADQPDSADSVGGYQVSRANAEYRYASP